MVAERNAQQTRERILEATFDLMYRNGYQGMRVDQILNATGLAKGALYHHFANKQALGYAVVDELLMRQMVNRWVIPLQNCQDPIEAITQVLNADCNVSTPEVSQFGCPLNNISQEMAGLDNGFHQRLEKIYNLWSETIATALTTGQKNGMIKASVEPNVTAIFLISSLQGIIGTTKCMQDDHMLVKLKGVLVDYLLSLRT